MSNYTENIIKILASLPEFLRKPMIRSRINDFFNMDDEEKFAIISNVLYTLPEIEFDILSKLIKTWVEVINILDEKKRYEIFNIYASILDNNPSILSRLNIEGLKKVFEEMDESMKDKIGSSIRTAIISKTNLLQNLSNDVKSMLKI
ncbi:MAG: hypothetical protein QW416_03495 [Candidatus Nitrosocaldaceae archaeon]